MTRRLFGLVVVAVLVALAAQAYAADHWVMKPCEGGTGTCFLPVSYPVYYYTEAAYNWGWGPAWDDGDGVPEAVILFPNIPQERSWEKINANGNYQTHYTNSDMPFLWCDARYFSSYDAFSSAIDTWGFNLKLLDIARDLGGVWTNASYSDLKGCWVGSGRFKETYAQPDSDQWNWTAEIVGSAVSESGQEYDVKMKVKMQVRLGSLPLPEGAHLESLEFLSTPIQH